MNYLLAFIASYVFVGLKAFQQLNVAHGEYMWVMPVSLLMAVCEVYVVAQAATMGVGWIVLAVGLGAGFGALSSMYLHKRMRG